MTKYVYIWALVFLTSCRQTTNNANKNEVVNSDAVSATIKNDSTKTFQLTDKTVKFLWRADTYDETLKDTLNSMFINQDFCKTMSDPEKAALGYVATFIGNDCWWDGAVKDGRSNLKCSILTALDLGYQCSDKHLGFLRQWFKADKKSLDALENCPTTPYTATIQDMFNEIILTVEGNKIAVFFKASGVNTREGKGWSWTETVHFKTDNGTIKLIKRDKSEVKQEHVEMGT